jgi:hypothetical protein
MDHDNSKESIFEAFIFEHNDSALKVLTTAQPCIKA